MKISLTVVTGPRAGAVFEVSSLGATLGRSRVADIHLEDGLLSRLHCRFYEEAGQAMVQDLGSSNGTLLNGVAVTAPQAIRTGDVVTVGETALRVDVAAGAGDAVAMPAPVPTMASAPMPAAAPVGAAAVPVAPPQATEGGAGHASAETPAAAEPGKVDLGLSPDAQGQPAKRRGVGVGLIVGLAAVAALVIGAGLFFSLGREGEGGARERSLPTARQLPFEFRYERLVIDAQKLFRYTLTYDNAGTLALAIDDLGDADRSFAKQKQLSPRAVEALRKELIDSRYTEIGPLYPERSADGVSLRRRALTIVLGAEVWARTAENVSDKAFDALCERLETFGRNELGAWATQYSVAELRDMAQEQLRLARRYWEQRDLGDEKLFACVTAYRKGLSALETLNPKPDFAQDLAQGLREAEALLAERHEALAFAVDQALNTQRYDAAAEALRTILRTIPDRDDPRNIEATERLLAVENRYLKGGK